MKRCLRTLTAAAVTLTMLALVLAIEARELGHSPAVVPDDDEVLATIEVRGQRFDLSDGRTARNATAASGLTALVQLAPGLAVPPAPIPVPTPAPTPVPMPTIAPSPLAARGAEALTLISYRWQEQLPGWVIDFLPERQGLRAVTFSREQRIEVYVRDDQPPWNIARVVAHELGHAVDLGHIGADDRRRWQEARGFGPERPWWPESGAADFFTGAGDFAECFATWQVGSVSLSELAGPCSDADLELVASLAGGA